MSLRLRIALIGLLFLTLLSPLGKVSQACVGTPYNPALEFAKTYSVAYHVPLDDMVQIIDNAYDLAAERGFPQAEDILAVISVESSFKKGAVHAKGPSVGLMQVNEGIHHSNEQAYYLRTLKGNMILGVKLLKEYRAQARSDIHALTAYNSGPNRAKRICNKQGTCNTAYSDKVLAAKARILAHLPRG
jgi:soluble lytic murein transglycosylase-like protein